MALRSYGSCRACRARGSRCAGPTGAWNYYGIPQALGNPCAIPTASTGPATRYSVSLSSETTKPFGLHGEYPIEVWHGVNQCLSLSDEMIPTELIDCSSPAH
jgi:hypothetical protein